MGKGRAEKPYFRDHMEAGRRPAANEPVMNPIKAAKIERAKKANAKKPPIQANQLLLANQLSSANWGSQLS